MSTDTRPTINLTSQNYEDSKACCNNIYLHGNLSDFFNKLFEAAKNSDLKIKITDFQSFTINELINLKAKNIFYDFKFDECEKKITREFRENFNNICDNGLKESCYKFIKAVIELLKRDAIFNNDVRNPRIGTSQNISIYDANFNHMLYINVKNTENGGLGISNLLQFNQRRNQPAIPKLWNIIIRFFNLSEDIKKVILSTQDFNEITEYLNSLKKM